MGGDRAGPATTQSDWRTRDRWLQRCEVPSEEEDLGLPLVMRTEEGPTPAFGGPDFPSSVRVLGSEARHPHWWGFSGHQLPPPVCMLGVPVPWVCECLGSRYPQESSYEDDLR